MKRLFIFSVATILGVFFASNSRAQMTVTLDSTVLEVDTIIDGLDIPWEITYGPDGWIWTTERFGRISRINPATGQQDVLLDISNDVYSSGESGLLGLVLHHDYWNTRWVYVAYTYGNFINSMERIVRYEYDGTTLINPLTLIDSIQGNTTHIGCRLMFLPDGTMLATTGDAQNTTLPQNVSALEGKVLRMNDDGSIPEDNPIPGSYVYSWGHRNAQGLFYHDGKIYSSEHGPSNDDEFHIIEPGRNYGWPNVEGFCDQSFEMNFCTDSNVVEPLFAWTPTIAPSDIYWYDNPAIPEWNDKMLMTVLKDKKIIALELDSNGTVGAAEQHYLTNMFGRLRDITVGPNGCVYLAANGNSWSNTNPNTHEIIRLCPQGVIGVGIEEVLSTPLSLQVNPNPTVGGIIQLKSEAELKNATFELLDLNGRLILEGNFNGSNTDIDARKVAAGSYILTVRSDDRIGTVKVNVQH